MSDICGYVMRDNSGSDYECGAIRSVHGTGLGKITYPFVAAEKPLDLDVIERDWLCVCGSPTRELITRVRHLEAERDAALAAIAQVRAIQQFPCKWPEDFPYIDGHNTALDKVRAALAPPASSDDKP